MKYTIEIYVGSTNEKRAILKVSTSDMCVIDMVEDEFEESATLDECARTVFDAYFAKKRLNP